VIEESNYYCFSFAVINTYYSVLFLVGIKIKTDNSKIFAQPFALMKENK